MRVGLIYDRQVRPDTTGTYLQSAMCQHTEVVYLQPGPSLNIPRADIDFYVVIDDGLDYPLPNHLRPRAAWAIDTHLGFQRCLQRFGDAELLFAAQKHDAYRLAEALGREVHWLPLACDPAMHCPKPDEIVTHDVVFVGNVVNAKRERWLSWLKRSFPGAWVGQAYFDEMSRALSRGKIGFNYSVAGDVNMRIFEIAACGLPVVTNRVFNNGLESLFATGQEIVVWECEEDLRQQLEQLLADENLRRQIARAGYDAALQRHTYSHRAQMLLEMIAASSPERRKPAGYFEHDRPDVRALIPETATEILDIGCGSGRLGAAIRRARTCRVTGVESSFQAATRARQVLDSVVCRKIGDAPVSQFRPNSFDCIVLADVLEHLRDPLATLKKCAHWLSCTGTLVVSVPNGRNFEVLESLVDGNWTYESAGLLDEDHVRTLTRRELEKLFFQAGFAVTQTRMVYSQGIDQLRDHYDAGQLRLNKVTISGLSRLDAEEFYGYQILMSAAKAKRTAFGLTSIVVVTHNQLAYTRMCVDSVLLRTDESFELIFVDNGSTDGTVEYLRSLSTAKTLFNTENRGFAPAVNQGLQVAQGEQVVLLNNDCIVTTGWLTSLLEALYSSARVGMVGPVSNCVSGEQQVPAGYPVLAALDGFAWERCKHPELCSTTRLVGFCLLFRRSVLEAIGALDERFRIGCYEDDDFCRRALEAGFDLKVARHVFVHHFGSATFKGAGIDLAQILQENSRRFAEKWDAERPYPEYAQVRQATTRVSLCMIVRDNEAIIEACLTSVRPWVDELIVVDTGSMDRTPELCRQLGAQVFDFPWCDNFSAARNESLRHATGDWIFWMDSDDQIDPVQGQRLRDLVRSKHAPECLGYVLQVHCPADDGHQATVVDHVKLFRNGRGLQFEHRIHEQILPSIRRAGGSVEFREIHVVHHGSRQTPEQRSRKLERDFRILQQDLREHPDHPFILFNLGMTCDDAGMYAQAIDYLEHCLCVSHPDESHVRKAWSILVNSLRLSGDPQRAIQKATSGLERYPDDVELRFRLAVLLQQTGDAQDAVGQYKQLLNQTEPRRFQSRDNSITGYKLHHNLALAYDQLGMASDAARHWESALSLSPESEAAQIEVARHAFQSGDVERLRQLSVAVATVPDNPRTASIVAMLAMAEGRPAEAEEVLWQAWRTTQNEEHLDELARLMVESGRPGQAVESLRQLLHHRPQCAATHFNLGQALLHSGQRDEARRYLERSLKLRPHHELTGRLLKTLYREDGQS